MLDQFFQPLTEVLIIVTSIIQCWCVIPYRFNDVFDDVKHTLTPYQSRLA